jgi:hypothetical protein
MMMSFYCPICGEVKGLEDAQKELKVLTIERDKLLSLVADNLYNGTEHIVELEAERDKLLATILEQEAEIFRLATIVQELTE